MDKFLTIERILESGNPAEQSIDKNASAFVENLDGATIWRSELVSRLQLRSWAAGGEGAE